VTSQITYIIQHKNQPKIELLIIKKINQAPRDRGLYTSSVKAFLGLNFLNKAIFVVFYKAIQTKQIKRTVKNGELCQSHEIAS
jgi:hypothetical protein